MVPLGDVLLDHVLEEVHELPKLGPTCRWVGGVSGVQGDGENRGA